MRRFLSLAAVLALAACGGGGGGSAPSNPPPTNAPSMTPTANLVTPQFTFTIPARTSSTGRQPRFISSTVDNVTITLNSVDGNPPTVVPTSKNSPLTPPCTPCSVPGPPSPPGLDKFTVTTYHGTTALDTNSITFTVNAGSANTGHSIVLQGIPITVVLGTLSTVNAGTTNSQTLSVLVKDADGNTITGTYAQPITITDPDTATYGAGVNGSTVSGGDQTGSCTTTCVIVKTDTSPAVMFNYTGLAENAVTVTGTGTGVTSPGAATFTPTLQAITWVAGPTSKAAGTPKGVDLYTTNAASGTAGYSDTESYTELGYTNTPYNKTLTTLASPTCTGTGVTGLGSFATLATTNNTTTTPHQTDFTASATIASPIAGICTETVSDGLTGAGHASGGPTFVITYTTSSIDGTSKRRQQ